VHCENTDIGGLRSKDGNLMLALKLYKRIYELCQKSFSLTTIITIVIGCLMNVAPHTCILFPFKLPLAFVAFFYHCRGIVTLCSIV